MKFKYEERVIDPILDAIKEHQEYLIKKENRPQLAKLGYMYNTLWYNGRICWGYDGEIQSGNDCEDNPKYKIEMCDPINDETENLIYDAWGMHVDNDMNKETFEEFAELVRNGKQYSDFDKRYRKPNKSFDEWVDVLTDSEFKYSSIYPNRRSVANHLLCVIGNGYGINEDGFIMNEAGGADQDIDGYGEWENAQFEIEEIKDMVERVLSYPEIKQTFDAVKIVREKHEERETNRKRKEEEEFKAAIAEMRETCDEAHKEEFDKIIKKPSEQEKTYGAYYPICNYSLITKSNLEPSAVAECVNICKEILDHQDIEKENNIKFAKELLLTHA